MKILNISDYLLLTLAVILLSLTSCQHKLTTNIINIQNLDELNERILAKDFDGVVNEILSAKKKYIQMDNTYGSMRCDNLLSRYYYYSNDFEKSKNIALNVLSKHNKEETGYIEIEALTNLGLANLKLKNINEGSQQVDSAFLELLKIHPDTSHVLFIPVLWNKGAREYHNPNSDSIITINYYKKLFFLIEHHYKSYIKYNLLAKSNNVLGTYYEFRLRKYQKALFYYTESLNNIYGKNLEGSPTHLKILANKGQCLMFLGEFDNSLNAFNEAIILNEKSDDKCFLSSLYQGKSTLYLKYSMLDNALDCTLNAIKFNDICKPTLQSYRFRVASMMTLSDVQFKIGNHPRAISYLNEANKINTTNLKGDVYEKYFLGHFYYKKALIYGALKDYKKSEDHIEKYLSISLENRDMTSYVHGLFARQENLSDQKDCYQLEKNVVMIRDTIAKYNLPSYFNLFSKTNLLRCNMIVHDKVELIDTLIFWTDSLSRSNGSGGGNQLLIHTEISNYFRAIGKYQEAVDFANKGLSFLKNEKSPINPNFPLRHEGYTDLLISKTKALYELYKENHKESLLKDLLNTIEISDSIINYKKTFLTDDNSIYEYIKLTKDIYRIAIYASHELYLKNNNSNHLDKMLSFSEKLKGYELYKKIREKESHKLDEIPLHFINRKDSLKLIIYKQEKGVGIDLIESNSKLNQYKRDLTYLEDFLRKNYPLYYLSQLEINIKSFQMIRNHLEINEAEVNYIFDSNEQLYTFISTIDTTIYFKNNNVNINSVIKDFRDGCKRGISPKEYYKKSRILSNILGLDKINHFLNSLKVEKICFISDDKMKLLPFSALVLSDNLNSSNSSYLDMNYLIKHFEISVGLSSNLRHIGKNKKPKNEYIYKYCGIAPSFIGESRLPELKCNTSNVLEIGNLFNNQLVVPNNHDQLPFEGNQTLSSKIIHFSTHSIIDINSPEYSYIAVNKTSNGDFSQDGKLTYDEIPLLNINSELIVLSTCSSGEGKEIEGEGILDLSRNFQYSHTDNIIYTIWKIDDTKSCKIMENFFKNVNVNKSYSRALKNAKNEAINKGMYPWDWGGFILSE